ncbi:hypothetical protein OBBRIDRAFT_526838 [Obba rivulosa]|uniref:Uncharacterized protein n=1 Tax=Obba rivulosa TaxID=1052685 RepID=A0A8E2B360_9APHY|nr:hypothetical protein OBBRIDRAFT_526838 [Obba rivulosa]
MESEGRDGSLLAAIAEKDAHITRLRVQVEAQATRASQIQARLLSTIDALDALQQSHTRELAEEQRVSERLTHRLHRLMEHVKVVDRERDDMRDAVLRLVEKVELVNDYALWPHSHIDLGSPVESLRKSSSSQSSDSEHGLVRTHAPVMIATLRTELDAERRAHARTREEAEAEILSLGMRLARREAELEAFVTRPERRVRELDAADVQSATMMHPASKPVNDRQSEGISSDQSTRRARPHQFTQEEAVEVLGIANSRNRALEIEVKDLHKRLEAARQIARRGRSPERRSPQHIAEKVMHRSSDAPQASPPEAPQASSAGAAGGHSPAVLAAGPRTRSHASVADPPGSPQLAPCSARLSPSPYVLSPRTAAATRAPSRQASLIPPSAIGAERRSQGFEQLKQEITRLSSEVDIIRAEHDELRNIVAVSQLAWQRVINVATTGPEEMGGQREGEAPPVNIISVPSHTDTEAALHIELAEVKRAGQAREERMQREIDSLKESLSQLSSKGVVPQGFSSGRRDNIHDTPSRSSGRRLSTNANGLQASRSATTVYLLDDYADEQSMELATPLQPTIMSVGQHDLAELTESPRVFDDPFNVPLPESPRYSETDMTSPRVPRSPYPPPPQLPLGELSPLESTFSTALFEGRAHSDANWRMEMIERELALARAELDEKDAALAELRDIVEQLRAVMIMEVTSRDENSDSGGG